MTASDQNADIEGVRADQLSELLARVEAAEGPDREIDTDLERLILKPADGAWETEEAGAPPGHEFKRWILRKPDGTIFVHGSARGYTRSLDAALALCERVLPGCELMFNSEDGRAKYHATVFVEPTRFWAYAKTAPLAFLAAMLRALLAQASRPTDPLSRSGRTS